MPARNFQTQRERAREKKKGGRSGGQKNSGMFSWLCSCPFHSWKLSQTGRLKVMVPNSPAQGDKYLFYESNQMQKLLLPQMTRSALTISGESRDFYNRKGNTQGLLYGKGWGWVGQQQW